MVSGTPVASADSAGAGPARRRLRVLWNGICAATGAVLGLVPHLLHHVGFLVGAAAVTGVVGNLVFGAVGLVLSVPFLLRLRRRFGTWRAPAIALVLFAGMFSLSAFVIGPAISGEGAPVAPVPGPTPGPTPSEEHAVHHDA